MTRDSTFIQAQFLQAGDHFFLEGELVRLESLWLEHARREGRTQKPATLYLTVERQSKRRLVTVGVNPTDMVELRGEE